MWQIAHRGYSHLYGDNNMTSFKKAHEVGFNMIELDVQMCESGDPIIHHDVHLHDKYISDFCYYELLQLGIVSLDDFFSEFAHTDILIFLDIKGDDRIIHRVLSLIQKWFTPQNIHRIFISSYDTSIIQPILDSKLKIHIGFTTENTFSVDQIEFITEHCDFVCYHWTALDLHSISYLRKKGILVFAYTCKNSFIENHMKKFNIDGIITNYPLQIT